MALDTIIQELKLPPSVQLYAASLNFDIRSDDGMGSSEWWIDRIESRVGMRLTCLSERAWDTHHDVIAVQKTRSE